MGLFKQNKYTDWYYRIIESAKKREREEAIYYERHHIIPKSLGGDNSNGNLIHLTAREHFICHRLLVKMVMTEGHLKKMTYAAWCMTRINSKHGRITVTNRTYSFLKEANIKAWREAAKGREPWNKGKKMPEEWVAKRRGISPANKGKPGRKPTKDERTKNSESVKAAMAKLKSDPVRWAAYAQKRSENSVMKKPVVVGGVEYPSLTSASQATGISKHLLRKHYLNQPQQQ